MFCIHVRIAPFIGRNSAITFINLLLAEIEADGILANMSELPVLLELLLVRMEAFFLCALRASLGGVWVGEVDCWRVAFLLFALFYNFVPTLHNVRHLGV